MRLIFMGTPDFAVPALNALTEAGHDVAMVYTQPPRAAGRGKKPRPTPVEVRAHALGLPVQSPSDFRNAEDLEAFAALNADAAIVVAYGLILPPAVLEAPTRGCLNVHASLLPRWRGAAPIHRAVMAGDEETGVCIMQMEHGLDTGPVVLRKSTPISHIDTTATLHDRLADLGALAIVEALDRIDLLQAVDQPEQGVSYAAKIDKSEAKIEWQNPAQIIDRQIRGLAPFPGAWCEIGGERIKILMSQIVDQAGSPGVVLDDQLTIACGEGAIRALTVQRAGKSAVDTATFLRGFAVAKSDRVR